MIETERSSPEALDEHVPGTLIASSRGRPWKDLLVQIYQRDPVQEEIIIPAVPEPLIVWVLSGNAIVEERELGSTWHANRVTAGDFFLTTSPRPCELRWTVSGSEPFQVMHLYLSLDLMNKAAKETYARDMESIRLREISGKQDEVLSAFLNQIRVELTSRHAPSGLFVRGIAQSMAVHLVRTYIDPDAKAQQHVGGLPAFRLQRVLNLLEARLDDEFSLPLLAHAAGFSEFHFSRAFKRTTGFSPSQYFIRLRMQRARRLLRETSKTVIEVGLDVGYSSPSHFAQVFRREVGVTPSEYRGQS